MAASSSSSSSSLLVKIPQPKYDVFLSFRGEDTRDNFVSHLYAALHRKQIQTFIDNQLIRGDEISNSLLSTIESSIMSVIVFSERYASSAWCLDELVKILERRNMYGQIVIPVFYRVDPSHVRNQTGVFGNFLLKLEERFQERLDKSQRWRIALREAANLSGFDSNVIRPESELIEKIANHILGRLSNKFGGYDEDNLIGVESTIDEIQSLLRTESIYIYKLGLWGIGGIGKTAIAKAIFSKMSNHFQGSCFIKDVRREEEKNKGLDHLWHKLFCALLGDENVNIDIPNNGFNFRRLSRKKVLVVFDDVSDFKQIESLIENLHCLGKGSRIMITTRDKHVLENCRVDRIYQVKELLRSDALKLFSQYTFGQNHPNVEYERLSHEIIKYAHGVPLALKVLGCFLFGRKKEVWESAIKKLKRIPNKDIQKVLRISFDSLDDAEKNIFLDIACFLKGENKDYAIKFLDACGFYPEIGIDVLVEKCLITISDNIITMHDLLQEMGREIVRQESIDDPAKRSRLWHHEDIYKVLTYNRGTKAIQGISFDMSQIEEINLNPCIFQKMPKLRFLNFYGENKCKFSHLRNSEFFELRYLQWQGYPLKSLPSRMHPENLVSLELYDSKVEKLWDGVQNLVMLKRIDLSNSKKLTKLPDLSNAQNLEELRLENCSSLVETHSSIQHLNKLVVMNLGSCESLKLLPPSIDSKFLKRLYFLGCRNLKRFPDISSYNIDVLYINRTGIKELPSSFECLTRLRRLDLTDCSRLKQLPTTIRKLKSLNYLDLSHCSNLRRLPDELGNVEELYLSSSGVEELPSSIEYQTRLRRLDLSNCSRLKQLPRSLCKLKSLEYLNLSDCSNLERLPDELGNLEGLRDLRAKRIAMREIPSSIVCLKNLEKLSFKGFRGHEQMVFLWPISLSLDGLHNLTHLKLSECGITELPESLGQLSSLRLFYSERLQCLPKLPCGLEYMDANHCTSLEVLSGLPSLFTFGMSNNYFQKFRLENCYKLDGNELREIVENAQQKVQLISAALLEEQHQAYSENYWGYISYPGSEIPEWFEFQSRGSSISLELPQGWFNNKVVGFACCANVAFEDHHYSYQDFNLWCEWKLKTEDGEWGIEPDGTFLVCEISYVDSNHTLLGFKLADDLFPHGFGEYHYNNEVLIQFSVKDTDAYTEYSEVVKKCGVQFFYRQDFGKSMKGHSRRFSIDEEEVTYPKRLKYSTSSF
ncbi:putative disease resistance protein (TIR-NBS-LRR class) [Melia azedarach]|uniref:Disease resistance protein (TIR-NBS-LRR class) n=1 Tax=Melia azedarach TaxID=155640 RepID=A0ACC1YK67_MELAZ|nr:putative disease resistance protein (TIR-NBS-LRR class) [Melia azedarach]